MFGVMGLAIPGDTGEDAAVETPATAVGIIIHAAAGSQGAADLIVEDGGGLLQEVAGELRVLAGGETIIKVSLAEVFEGHGVLGAAVVILGTDRFGGQPRKGCR